MDGTSGLFRNVSMTNLLLVHAGIALVAAAGNSPSYDLPIYLFGILIWKEQSPDIAKMQQFLVLFASTVLIDIIWSIVQDSLGISYIFTLINMCLKPLTVILGIQFLQNNGATLPTFVLRGDYERMDGSSESGMPGNFNQS